jgi:hypothetical protein
LELRVVLHVFARSGFALTWMAEAAVTTWFVLERSSGFVLAYNAAEI